MTLASRRLYGVAAAGGALLWLATMAVSGRGEAWDSALYWSVAYALCIALAAAQPVMLILTSGSFFGLLCSG